MATYRRSGGGRFREVSPQGVKILSISLLSSFGLLTCTIQHPFESAVRYLFSRLRVVSNFGDCDCGAGKIHTRARSSLRVASPRNFARARVYFARATIGIAKIRDYSQSIFLVVHKTTFETFEHCKAKEF